MVSPRTNIFLVAANGNTIIDDMVDGACLSCIGECVKKGQKSIACPLDAVKRHVFYLCDDKGKLYICDDKERTTKNFQILVDLILHSRPALIKRHAEIASDINRKYFRELDALEHNIVHINADAINVFYSFITQDTLVTNYRKLQDLIQDNINKHPEEAVELIARLARYNLNIKTELSVVAKLNNPDGKPSYNVSKPRDAIMTSVYMLYPLLKKRKVYVDVEECWDRFELDYDALQVASFYIIENATKYTEKGSTIIISFHRQQHNFLIEFKMRSLHVEQAEVEHIFDEGYRGSQAQKTGKGGKGIGLYRARRIARFCDGDLRLVAGGETKTGADRFEYADNKFIIELPFRTPVG